MFCPSQSYRGRDLDGGEKPKILPPHIAADRFCFVTFPVFSTLWGMVARVERSGSTLIGYAKQH
eukprot:487047-Pleurochrysis_carterae.AAC.1